MQTPSRSIAAVEAAAIARSNDDNDSGVRVATSKQHIVVYMQRLELSECSDDDDDAASEVEDSSAECESEELGVAGKPRVDVNTFDARGRTQAWW